MPEERQDDGRSVCRVIQRQHARSHMFARTHRREQSVHLLFVNQLRRVHKVLAVEQDDGGGDGAGGPPEGHVGQGLRPRITCTDEQSSMDVVGGNSRDRLTPEPKHKIFHRFQMLMRSM